MENEITARQAGTIEELGVTEGDADLDRRHDRRHQVAAHSQQPISRARIRREYAGVRLPGMAWSSSRRARRPSSRRLPLARGRRSRAGASPVRAICSRSPADARRPSPIILTGADLPATGRRRLEPDRQAAARPTDGGRRIPDRGGPTTGDADRDCAHNHYATPEVDTRRLARRRRDRRSTALLGYRWDEQGEKFAQIPFQVDEVVHALPRQHGVGLRALLGRGPAHDLRLRPRGLPLRARTTRRRPVPRAAATAPATTPDPVKGLDNNDELAFMASDAGAAGARRRGAAEGHRGRAARSRVDRPDEPGARRATST